MDDFDSFKSFICTLTRNLYLISHLDWNILFLNWNSLLNALKREKTIISIKRYIRYIRFMGASMTQYSKASCRFHDCDLNLNKYTFVYINIIMIEKRSKEFARIIPGFLVSVFMRYGGKLLYNFFSLISFLKTCGECVTLFYLLIKPVWHLL